MQAPKPVTLHNPYVTLKPISVDEAEAYLQIGQSPEIWRYLSGDPWRTQDDARAWIAHRLDNAAASGEVVFSIYDRQRNALAGTSSYIDIRTAHGALEIGYTWYGTTFQRTHVNTASKLALLEHAFETLGANRVQLQTDARNTRSQQAIKRIGAEREGLLRMHKIYPDGYVRDSVLFALVKPDWPAAKDKLQARLDRS